MRVLIVTDAWYPQVNGVVRTYEYLRGELETMGCTVKIIGPADFSLCFAMPGYAEIQLALFPYNRLRRMIAAYAPDVLHIATEGPLGIAARKYAVRYGVEFTSCYHTHFPDYAAKRVPDFMADWVRAAAIHFIRWFHTPSSCLFVATGSLEQTLRGWNFTMPIKRMTRGIDHAIFFTGEKKLFGALQRPIALYVGRVTVEKNLEAFLDMPWEGSKIVVGNGPDFETLKKKYTSAFFAGIKTGRELADFYRSADVFVFPSKTDTFGMVIVEALACGLPVAAYPVTGPIDIITAPFLGALDDDLSKAAQDALLYGTADERADHARENYSWRRATEQFLEIENT